MSTTLSDTLRTYVDAGHTGAIYCIGDDFGIIRNPSFAILPNHPYRSPLVVALYCTAGHATGRINALTYDIREGSYFVVLPGQITEFVDTSTDFSATYIIMSDDFTAGLGIGNTFDIASIVAASPHVHLEGRARTSLEAYIAMCESLIPIESNPHRMEILHLLTRAFFLGLGHFLHEPTTTTTTRQSEITSSFIHLVEQSYVEHRDLAYYADILRLTPKYLSTVVKETSGKSATEWIEKYVTLDAITQLTSTSKSIKQIAYDLNFPSQSFFGKYFARIVGCSPAAYREKETTK
ncbi:MAG: AraC family transcriptional regulator [Alistipes sp.]|nr:AraC family transcriptional regulator [Alistipes sp.]